MKQCGHEEQHPLFGLPFVCTKDEHGSDTGHVYEYKHAKVIAETLAADLAAIERAAVAAGEAIVRGMRVPRRPASDTLQETK